MAYACVVVIPVYNEAQNLPSHIQDWHSTLASLCGDDFLLLYIDDGSRDNSAPIIKQAAQTHPQIKLIEQDNIGHGGAILTGYRHAAVLDTDFIFQTDSDQQIPAREFENLWQKRRASTCLLGLRKHRKDPFYRRLISGITSLLIRVFYGLSIPDPNIPFRLFERHFLLQLLKTLPQDCFAPNIFLSIAAKQKHAQLMHIPVAHAPRTAGINSLPSGKLLAACLRSFKELKRHAK